MHNNKLVFSVDGGGSSSDGVVYDRIGKEIDRIKVGPLSLKSSSADVVSESMLGLFKFLEDRFNDVGSCVLGLSGLDSEKDVAQIISIMANVGFFEESPKVTKTPFASIMESYWGFPVILCSDALMPLFANGLDAGTILIAGTGSIAIHLDKNGHPTRYGGWGYAVSDSGSGTWVGMEFLRESLSSCDRATSAIRNGYDAQDDDIQMIDIACKALFDPEDPVNKDDSISLRIDAIEKWSIRNSDPKVYASLTKGILKEAYSSRDSPCRKIAQKAAIQLSDIAALSFCADSPAIVMAGGLFKNKDFAKEVASLIIDKCPDSPDIIVNKKDLAFGGIGISHYIGKSVDAF